MHPPRTLTLTAPPPPPHRSLRRHFTDLDQQQSHNDTTMPASISSLSTIEAPSVRFPWGEKFEDQDLSPRHERILCPDGHPAEFDQPAIPTQHVSEPRRPAT